MKRKKEFRRAQEGFSLIELLIVVAIIAILLMVAVPEAIESFKTGRESAAMQTLGTIHKAQVMYHTRKQRFGTLKELNEAGLIISSYVNGAAVSGYIFSSAAEVTQDKYCVQATRQAPSSAYKDFNVTEDGTIRFVESNTPTPIPHGEGAPLASAGTGAQ
jgi:prepilin-type N-terminal cleavage/methylation domain-containing protein